MQLESNTSLLFVRLKARQRVELTGVVLAGGPELASLVKKVTVDPVEKAAPGLHTVLIE